MNTEIAVREKYLLKQPILVYVAGPLTLYNAAHNIHVAVLIAEELLKMGFIPFVPHFNHIWDMVCPKEPADWLRMDLVILARCDVLFRILGESEGADEEEDLAVKLGIPVYYTLQDIAELTIP